MPHPEKTEDRRPHRRPPYSIGSESSGLSRPREWIGFIVTVFVILALIAPIGTTFS